MGRPTQHTPLSFLLWGRQAPGRGSKTTRVRYAIPESHTRPQGRAGSGPASVAAAIAAGTRPDFPFPNPEAKTASADGTAPARVWESRTPPPTQTHKREGGPHRGPPPFVCPTPAPTPQTHNTQATHAHRASAHTIHPHPQTEHPHTAGRIPSRPHNPNPTPAHTQHTSQ